MSCYKQPSTNAKYHYSYYFFHKRNKGDLPFMDCCVFWCELTDLVGFLACLLEGGLRPENPSNRRFFRPEANF